MYVGNIFTSIRLEKEFNFLELNSNIDIALCNKVDINENDEIINILLICQKTILI